MARHVHADLIHKWCEGAEIQFKDEHDEWIDIAPTWNVNREYRIKPRIVKREGWVNIYPGAQNYITGHIVYASKEEARNESMGACVATTKIKWAEEA